MNEKDIAVIREQLLELARRPDNAICADCGEKDPQWASANLGLFICIVCAGIHRNLGVHISRVKSLMLDTWKAEEVEVMKAMGNRKSNEIWEGALNNCHPVRAADSVILREQWIRAKYVRKLYQKRDGYSPKPMELPSREGWMTKKGDVVKNWKRRWFKLNGSMMFYYKKQQDAIPAGYVCLAESTRHPDCLAEQQPDRPFCFMVSTPNRDYYISPDTGDDMYDWIQTIRMARHYLCTPNTFGFTGKARECTPPQLEQAGGDMARSPMATQKRKWNGKVYTNCLHGAQVVDWLIHTFKLESRAEAIVLGQLLMNKSLLRSATGDPVFADLASLFHPILPSSS